MKRGRKKLERGFVNVIIFYETNMSPSCGFVTCGLLCFVFTEQKDEVSKWILNRFKGLGTQKSEKLKWDEVKVC